MTTRVLVTGMGGELGTRVAQLIEARDWATEIVGVDFVPPRRRLRRAQFRRIDPRDGERLAAFVEEYAPNVVAHFGVYEPASRMTPESARERTESCTSATLTAAASTGALEYVVLRSGLEVYGPPSARVSVPDEDAVPGPTTPYGRSLLSVEAAAKGLALRSGVPVGALALRAGARIARAEPVGPAAPAPGRAGERVLGSALLGAASRRRRARDGRGDREAARRTVQRRGPGCRDALAGGAPRWSRSGTGARPVCGARSARVRGRGSRAGGACRRSHPPRVHGRRQPGTRRARSRRSDPDPGRLARAVRLGRRGSHRRAPGSRPRERRSGRVRRARTAGSARRRPGHCARADLGRDCAAEYPVGTRSTRSASTRNSPTSVVPAVRSRGARARCGWRTRSRDRAHRHRLEPRLRGCRTRRARRRGTTGERAASARRRRARRSVLPHDHASSRRDLEQRSRCRGRAAGRSSGRHSARAHVAAYRSGRSAARGGAGAHARPDRPRGRAAGRSFRRACWDRGKSRSVRW